MSECSHFKMVRFCDPSITIKLPNYNFVFHELRFRKGKTMNFDKNNNVGIIHFHWHPLSPSN